MQHIQQSEVELVDNWRLIEWGLLHADQEKTNSSQQCTNTERKFSCFVSHDITTVAPEQQLIKLAQDWNAISRKPCSFV